MRTYRRQGNDNTDCISNIFIHEIDVGTENIKELRGYKAISKIHVASLLAHFKDRKQSG